jgi:hypothetical protein
MRARLRRVGILEDVETMAEVVHRAASVVVSARNVRRDCCSITPAASAPALFRSCRPRAARSRSSHLSCLPDAGAENSPGGFPGRSSSRPRCHRRRGGHPAGSFDRETVATIWRVCRCPHGYPVSGIGSWSTRSSATISSTTPTLPPTKPGQPLHGDVLVRLSVPFVCHDGKRTRVAASCNHAINAERHAHCV